MAVRYMTVVADSRRTVEAYLYSNARIVADGHANGRYAAVVEVTGQTERDVDYLAEHQQSRLASGLTTSQTFTAYLSAVAAVANTFGISVLAEIDK